MKQSTLHPDLPTEDRLGRFVAARLSESAETLPHDISERLRVARLQALTRHRALQPALEANVIAQGRAAALSYGSGEGGLWHRLAGLIPMLLLIVGLMVVSIIDDDFRAKELAEIDAAILTDDLPPDAYTDPGFVQFLKTRLEASQ